MSPRKKGTKEEIHRIRKLLVNNDLKTDPKYRNAWAQMSNAAARDALYHVKLTSKALRNSKISGFADLSVPDISSPTFQLPIPSLAFVAIKMFKTLEVKLGKGGRGNLNVSHSQYWLTAVEEINQFVANNRQVRPLQILDPARNYCVLTSDELAAVREHRNGSNDELSGPLCPSDDDDDSPINVSDHDAQGDN